MIEFFEFLNTTSPLRAVTYLIFLLFVMFFTYTLIESIIGTIFGGKKKEDKTEKKDAEVLNG